MNANKVIVLKDLGPSYTPEQHNLVGARERGHAFKLVGNELIEGNVPDNPDPESISKETWATITTLFSKNRSTYRWLRILVNETDLNPLTCDEEDVYQFLKSRFIDNPTTEKSYKKKTLKGACFSLRTNFNNIGRFHDWDRGAKCTSEVRGTVWMHTSNPMSWGKQKVLEDLLTAKNKELFPVPSAHATSKKNGKDMENNKAIPVSITLVVYLILARLEKAATLFYRWRENKYKRVSEIVNLITIQLLLVFLMHEGSRPGELLSTHDGPNTTLGGLKHTDLVLPLYEPVYWLTLVFLSPATLEFILRSGFLTRHITYLYKGKEVQAGRKNYKLDRNKPVIPTPFNTLDTLWHYIVVMKLQFMIEPDTLDSPYVFKQKMNAADLNKNANQSFGISGMTFYSIRRAIAEEDKVCKIPTDWRRARMGHSEKSNQNEEYADNQDRVMDIPLGIDLPDPKPDLDNLEFIKKSITLKSKWLTNLSKDQQEEFKETAALVKALLLSTDSAPNIKEKLLSKLQDQQENLFEHIPLGIHYHIPETQFPESIKTRFTAIIDNLKSMFGEVEEPKNKIQLSYYCPVVYGKWKEFQEADDSDDESTQNKDKDYDSDSKSEEEIDSKLKVQIKTPGQKRKLIIDPSSSSSPSDKTNPLKMLADYGTDTESDKGPTPTPTPNHNPNPTPNPSPSPSPKHNTVLQKRSWNPSRKFLDMAAQE